MCALNVVAEWEERVAAHGNALKRRKPSRFLLTGEHLRLLREKLLPNTVAQHVVMLLTDVHVNGVVAVRTADALLKRQIQHLFMLTQIPDVRLVARKTRAVDAALLAGADADGLSVLRIADGVRLRVFQRDEGEH